MYIAEIPIIGNPETGELDMFSLFFLKHVLSQVLDDADCTGVILIADSSGCSYSTDVIDIADMIWNAKKPVHGFIQGSALSGLYWMLSQARGGISCHRGGEAGSIGVVAAYQDLSKAAEMEGIRPVVIRSGDDKAPGMPGEPITPRVEEMARKRLMEIYASFSADVVRARPSVKPDELKGGVFNAVESKALGLIDHIETFEEFKTRVMQPATIR